MLPLIYPIGTDEDFKAWIHNEAALLGYTTVRGYEAFERNFLPYYSGERILTQTAYIADTPRALSCIYGDTDEKQILDTVLNHTDFGMTLPFITYGEQAQNLRIMLRPHMPRPAEKIIASWGMYHSAHICPECAEEDIKRIGFPVIHEPHCLQGAHVCWKHGCPLFTVEHAPDGACLPGRAVALTATEPEELMYARFMHSLYSTPVFVSRKETVARSVFLLRTRFDSIVSFVEELRSQGYTDGLAAYDTTKLNGFMDINKLSVEGLSRVVAFIYRQADAFKEDVLQISNRLKSQFRSSVSNQFEISSWGPVGKFRCSCGSTFYAHPYDLMLGGGCPSCDANRTDDEIINRYLKNIGDGNYTIIPGTYSSLSDMKAQILHSTCGKTRTRSLSKVIYNQIRCDCERFKTIERIERELLEKGAPFTVTGVRRENGVLIPTLICQRCNHEFDGKSTFKILKECPACGWPNRVKVTVKEKQLSLAQTRVDPSGKTFRVLSVDYVEKTSKRHISVQCLKCGNIMADRDYSSFVLRRVCGECGALIPNADGTSPDKSLKATVEAAQKRLDPDRIGFIVEAVRVEQSGEKIGTYRCKNCNLKFEHELYSFQRNRICPVCHMALYNGYGQMVPQKKARIDINKIQLEHDPLSKRMKILSYDPLKRQFVVYCKRCNEEFTISKINFLRTFQHRKCGNKWEL